MHIGEEKAFIYGMMKDITEERRRLTDQYFSLKLRLDDLIKLEEKGLDQISTKGFMDLFNDRDARQQIANISREMNHAIESRNPAPPPAPLPTPRFDRAAATLAEGQAEREAERARREALREKEQEIAAASEREDERSYEEQVRMHKEAAELAMKEAARAERELEDENRARQSTTFADLKPAVTQLEIDLAKERDAKNSKLKPVKPKVKKKSAPLKLAELADVIVGVLRENGGVMSSNEIYEVVLLRTGGEIDKKNFTGNIMFRAKKLPHIHALGAGQYKYVE